MRKVLITGGLGYLGGRLASSLQSAGHYLKLGTRSLAQQPAWLSSGEIVTMNFKTKSSLAKACEGIDILIHLAALNHQECVKDPEQALNVNTLGTLKLLDVAVQAGVKKFVYFSTAHVYGSPLEGEITEQTLTRPVNPYALTHKFAEDYVLAARASGKMNSIVIRLSNSFGRPMSAKANCWGLLVNDLCKQAVVHRHLQIYSAGLQRRDFVTIDNVQRAVLHLLSLPKEKLGNGVFNVGGGWAPRIMEMVCLIQERCQAVLGYRPDIISPAKKNKDVDSPLTFSIEKLLSTGFYLNNNTIDELDRLLLMCQREFSLNENK